MKKFDVKKYRKEYYQKNKEKIKEKVRLWRDNNKEGVIQYKKEWRERPEVKERMKEWYKNYNNKSEVKEKKRKRSREEYKTSKRKEYLRLYIRENREKIKENKMKYSRSQKGLNKKQEYENKPEIKLKITNYKKLWMRERLKNDLDFAIKHRLKRRLRHAINLYVKEKRYINSKKFDLDFEKIIEHLKPFPKDISKYHIDHIKPLCSFNLINLEQIKIAFSPENHQWLLARDNLKKGGKIQNE